MPVVNREAERALVQRAQARGMQPDQIKEAVLAYRQQLGGGTPAVAQPTEPEKPGIVQSLAQGIASPFLKTATSGLNVLEGTGDLVSSAIAGAMGDKERAALLRQRAAQAPEKVRDFGYLGKAAPVGSAPLTGNVGKDISTGVKDILGTGAEIGSYFAPIGPEAGLLTKGAEAGLETAGKGILKAGAEAITPVAETAIKAAKTPLSTLGKFGAIQGALSSTGNALQEDKGIGQTLLAGAGGALAGGVLGAGLPGIGRAVKGGAGVIGDVASKTAQTLPERLVNNILKPSKTAFSFGKNPGKVVAELGITGNSEQHFLENITSALQSHGEAIGNTIKGLREKPIVFTQDVLAPLDKAITQANKFKRTNQPLISRLEALKADLIDSAAGAKKITPQQAFEMKKEIGNISKWTGQAFDAELNQARVGVYRELKTALEKAANEQYGHLSTQSQSLRKLNERYGNLLEAQNALESRIGVTQRNNMIGLGDIGTTGVLAAAGAGPLALIGLALKKSAETVAVKSRVAALLSSVVKSMSAEDEAVIAKAIPNIADTFESLATKEKGDFIRSLPTLAKVLRDAARDTAPKVLRGAAIKGAQQAISPPGPTTPSNQENQ